MDDFFIKRIQLPGMGYPPAPPDPETTARQVGASFPVPTAIASMKKKLQPEKAYTHDDFDTANDVWRGTVPAKTPNDMFAAMDTIMAEAKQQLTPKELEKHAGRPDKIIDLIQKRIKHEPELLQGIKEETEEHPTVVQGNPAIAEQIARDHLKEHPHYYDHLDKMEAKLKKQKKLRRKA